MKLRNRNRHKLRIKLGEGVRGHYHLMSRTVNGEKWFGLREKEYLRKLIWQVAGFSGVRVITYAVMDNHFHVLAEVPPERVVSDGEIVRRFAVLYPEPTPWQPLTAEDLAKLLAANEVRGQELREELLARMHDVSWLMKTIKQRFAIWFQQAAGAVRPGLGGAVQERAGGGRCEGAADGGGPTLISTGCGPGSPTIRRTTVFCGYAEAVAGHGAAVDGLSVLACGGLAGYRQSLFGIAAAPKEGKDSVDPATASRVIEQERGKLSIPEILHCKCRYLTEGYIIGCREFVREVSEPLQRNPGNDRSGRSRWKAPIGTG